METKDLEKVTQLFLKRRGLLVFLVHLGIAFVVSFLHVTFTQYLIGLYGCRFQITKRNNITAIFRLLFLTISTISAMSLRTSCGSWLVVDWIGFKNSTFSLALYLFNGLLLNCNVKFAWYGIQFSMDIRILFYNIVRDCAALKAVVCTSQEWRLTNPGGWLTSLRHGGTHL